MDLGYGEAPPLIRNDVMAIACPMTETGDTTKFRPGFLAKRAVT